MLNGEVGDGTFIYAVGVFNGAPDGGNGPDFDPQSSKDYVGRLFFHPLRPAHRDVLRNLGLGVAGSYGSVAGAASSLPTYKSDRPADHLHATCPATVGDRHRARHRRRAARARPLARVAADLLVRRPRRLLAEYVTHLAERAAERRRPPTSRRARGT